MKDDRSALRGWRWRRRNIGWRSGRPAHVAEALECLGGNGYVEESPMPRLYREAPLNSIWEGSGNVIALDVLRAIKRRSRRRWSAFARKLVCAPIRG